MRIAYIDSSCLVAVALEEPAGREMRARMMQCDALVSSNLLEAEYLARLARERVEGSDLLSWMTWIHPERALSREIARVLQSGYLRGPDLWHLATALYLAETPSELPFLTLDARQREVAAMLGFPTD